MKIASLNINNFWQFKSLIYAIEDNFGDFIIQFKESGVFGKGIDRSHITFMEFVLTPEYFVSYECHNEAKIEIDFETLKRNVKRIKKGSKVTINVYDEMVNLNVSRGQNMLLVANAEISEYDPPTAPNLEFSESLLLKTKDFEQLTKDLNEITDRPYLKIVDNRLIIEKNGVEGMIMGKRDSTKECMSALNLNNLECVWKCKDFSDRIEIIFGQFTPVSLTYKSHRPGGFVNFLIAPIIEEEDRDKVEGCGSCPGEEEEVCDTCTGDD